MIIFLCRRLSILASHHHLCAFSKEGELPTALNLQRPLLPPLLALFPQDLKVLSKNPAAGVREVWSRATLYELDSMQSIGQRGAIEPSVALL